MMTTWKISVLGILICLCLCSCQSFFGPGVSSGIPSDNAAATGYSGEAIQFLVKSTNGMIQVRGPGEQDWRFLKPGETLPMNSFVRTGFDSSADLVMIEQGREVEMKLSSLLPELVLADTYEKFLSSEGYREYLEERSERRGACAAGRAILVSRTTLAQLEDNDFLEVANLNLELKNFGAGRSSTVGGASAGGSGGGGGGGGGSGG